MGTWSQACHTRRMGHRLCACRRHCETHAEGACASGGRFAEPWASSVSALFLGRCFLGAVAEDTLYARMEHAEVLLRPMVLFCRVLLILDLCLNLAKAET